MRIKNLYYRSYCKSSLIHGKNLSRLTLIVLTMLLCSCAARMHTSNMHAIKDGLMGPRSAEVLSELEVKVFPGTVGKRFHEDLDPVLLLELGAAYCYQGRFDESNLVLEKAYNLYSAQEDRAIISLTEQRETGGFSVRQPPRR